jgi:hypothetical protein
VVTAAAGFTAAADPAAALPMDSAGRAVPEEAFTAVMRLTRVTDTMLPVVVRTVRVTGRGTRLIAPIIPATGGIGAGAIVLITTAIGHTGGVTALTGGGRIPGGRITRGGVTPTGGGRLTILTGRPTDITGTGAIRE